MPMCSSADTCESLINLLLGGIFKFSSFCLSQKQIIFITLTGQSRCDLLPSRVNAQVHLPASILETNQSINSAINNVSRNRSLQLLDRELSGGRVKHAPGSFRHMAIVTSKQRWVLLGHTLVAMDQDMM